MPAQEISHRRQFVLVWSKTGDDVHAQPIVSTLSELLLVRFSNKQTEALDPHGNTIRVDATMVTAEDVVMGSIMWAGTYEDLAALLGQATADETDIPDQDLFQVVTFNGTPDVKARVTQRTVGLMRWMDKMPTQAN